MDRNQIDAALAAVREIEENLIQSECFSIHSTQFNARVESAHTNLETLCLAMGRKIEDREDV
jgi:hypothetical protein